LILQGSLVSYHPRDGWDISLPLTPLQRNLFHVEGCQCPTDSVFEPVPGLADYQGKYRDRYQVEDSRYYANRIQEQVGIEFNRLFAEASLVSTHCPRSQQLWRVFHYCNLPVNAARTKNGTAVGGLLQPALYDVLNHDCLRWFYPGHYDRFRQSALRIVPVIIENCIFRASFHHIGRAVSPLLGGAWGFSFQLEPIHHSWYIAKLVRNIVGNREGTKRPRLAIRINPFNEADFDYPSQVTPEPVLVPAQPLCSIGTHLSPFVFTPGRTPSYRLTAPGGSFAHYGPWPSATTP
jgi:hypothetical protein